MLTGTQMSVPQMGNKPGSCGLGNIFRYKRCGCEKIADRIGRHRDDDQPAQDVEGGNPGSSVVGHR